MSKQNVIIGAALILIIAAFMGGLSYGLDRGRIEGRQEVQDEVLQSLNDKAAQNQVAPSPSATEPSNPVSSIEGKESTQNITITGSYNIYTDGLMPNTLCFHTDAASGKKLTDVAGERGICFTNQSEARKLLQVDSAGKLGYPACDTISGKATILINQYKQSTTGGDALDSATLVAVTKVISAPTCGRGGPSS